VRVAVTGATGFVGRQVVKRLANAGHEIVAVVREGSPRDVLPEGTLEYATGDVADAVALEAAFRGCEAVVHLVGIIRETSGSTFQSVHVAGTRNVVEAARRAGVRRIVHMSALGTRADAASRYHRTKWDGEQAVRECGLEWVILRPSLIFGKGDGFTSTVIGLVNSWLLIPVIGSGDNLLQPIAVEDVSSIFLACLEKPEHVGQVYELGGPEQLRFREIVRVVARQMGSHKPRVHVPLPLVRMSCAVLSRLSRRFPLTPDLLLMLREDNVAEPNAAADVFGLSLTRFAAGLKRILAR